MPRTSHEHRHPGQNSADASAHLTGKKSPRTKSIAPNQIKYPEPAMDIGVQAKTVQVHRHTWLGKSPPEPNLLPQTKWNAPNQIKYPEPAMDIGVQAKTVQVHRCTWLKGWSPEPKVKVSWQKDHPHTFTYPTPTVWWSLCRNFTKQ